VQASFWQENRHAQLACLRLQCRRGHGRRVPALRDPPPRRLL